MVVFIVGDAGVGVLEDLYYIASCHPTIEGQINRHIVNYQAQWSTGTRIKRRGTRHILGISHLNQAVFNTRHI